MFEQFSHTEQIGFFKKLRSFDYILLLGIMHHLNDTEVKKLILPSPFFLEDQLSFYSFKSELDINSEEYIDKISEQIFLLPKTKFVS